MPDFASSQGIDPQTAKALAERLDSQRMGSPALPPPPRPEPRMGG